MKSKFTPLVKLKKDKLKECEQDFLQANKNKNSAKKSLDQAYIDLENISSPHDGNIANFLQSRTLLSAQRDTINHNKEWLSFAIKQVNEAQDTLKKSSLEYEKFKYLETSQIQQMIKELKIKESKALDEVALMGFVRRMDRA